MILLLAARCYTSRRIFLGWRDGSGVFSVPCAAELLANCEQWCAKRATVTGTYVNSTHFLSERSDP